MTASCLLCGLVIDGRVDPLMDPGRDTRQWRVLMTEAQHHFVTRHSEWLNRNLIGWVELLADLVVSRQMASADPRFAVQQAFCRQALSLHVADPAGNSEDAGCAATP